MVKDETLKMMATRAGVDIADDTKFTAFKEALTSDAEVEVTMPEKRHNFSEEELGSRDKSKYEEGKLAGVEMEIKQFKTDNSLEFEGKSITKLVDHVKDAATTAAGVAPEAKYKELEIKYKGVVTDKETLTSDLQEKDNQLLAFGARSGLTTALASKNIETTIPANKIETLFLSEYDIVDGKHAKKKGAADVVKTDDTLIPIAYTDVYLTYAEQYAKKPSLGPGGGGGGGKGAEAIFTKMSEYTTWKNETKPEQDVADKVLINSAKANPDFYKD